MTARVLVVDDVPANVKLLEARLSAEYFDVVTAMSGQDALTICERAECDLVLLDVMMPDLDGFEVCRRLKTNPLTHHIPVVMVTALDQPSDRVRGLEAGADDFLTKPIPELALIARVRSLARLKMVTDELRMRALTSRDIGIELPEREAVADAGRGGRVLIVDDRAGSYERIAATLAVEHSVEVEANPTEALFRAADGNYDLLIVSLGSGEFRRAAAVQPDPLARPHPERADPRHHRARQQCAHGSRARTRRERLSDAPGRQERAVGARPHPGPQAPLYRAAARQRADLHRDGDHRRAHRPVQPALHGKSSGDADRAGGARGKPLSALMLDIDYFKAINDTYGHDAGDDVLRDFALRIKRSIRGIDLACRTGGEEFVIVMPETDMAVAAMVAERLRRRIAAEPFAVNQGQRSIPVTLSIGIAALRGQDDNAASLLKRADQALYRAKRDGRNRVVPDAA